MCGMRVSRHLNSLHTSALYNVTVARNRTIAYLEFTGDDSTSSSGLSQVALCVGRMSPPTPCCRQVG